jgi:hypothetical protein
MRNFRNVRNLALGAVLGGLVIAGAAWAENPRTSVPVIKPAPAVQGSQKAASTSSSLSRTIINNIDHYDPSQPENYYHGKITDPSVSWQEKCRLAIQHGRLALLSSDIGGSLGGTREVGSSTLHIRLLCPDEIANFEIPASFTVDTAPHPEELGPMSFDTDMYAIEGSATNVGIFASIHLVGGTSNGTKSPGHTSLIPASDGSYAINSTFNIGYHLDFVGTKGGPLDGASGSIDSSILMTAVGK